jgi:hypothetical protein
MTESESNVLTVSKWQPLSTAPMDGTWVLAYDGKSPWPDDVEETYFIARYQNGGWNIALDGQPTLFTHWMPLPEPPAST